MIEPLKATQLSAKLSHARRRLQTFESEVRNGLPCRERAGREFADVMRYLRTIETEIAVAIQAPDSQSESRSP